VFCANPTQCTFEKQALVVCHSSNDCPDAGTCDAVAEFTIDFGVCD